MNCSRAFVLGISVLCSAPRADGQSVLRPIDSVRVRETSTLMIGTLGPIASGSAGQLFVSDWSDMRIVQLQRSGAIVRTYGRKGGGPGEFKNSSSLIAQNDSTLLVWDASMRRLSWFDTRTGKYRSSVLATLRDPTFVVVGNETVSSVPNDKTFTSTATLLPSGDLTRAEGVLPAIAHKYPMLLGPLGQMAFAITGNEVWASYALSQSLFHWTRGATTGSEMPLRVTLRRGVSTPALEQLVKDPSTAGLRVYDRSYPATMRFISPNVLALISQDLTYIPKDSRFVGQYFLTLVDVKAARMCGDFKMPLPTDPLAQVAFAGDTVVAVQQGTAKDGESAIAILRFAIDQKQCKWIAAN